MIEFWTNEDEPVKTLEESERYNPFNRGNKFEMKSHNIEEEIANIEIIYEIPLDMPEIYLY